MRLLAAIFALVIGHIRAGSIEHEKLALRAVNRRWIADLAPNLAFHDTVRFGALIRRRLVVKTDRVPQTLGHVHHADRTCHCRLCRRNRPHLVAHGDVHRLALLVRYGLIRLNAPNDGADIALQAAARFIFRLAGGTGGVLGGHVGGIIRLPARLLGRKRGDIGGRQTKCRRIGADIGDERLLPSLKIPISVGNVVLSRF